MINPMNWATAVLALAVSVQSAAVHPAIGHLYGRAEPLPTVVYRGSASSPDVVKERGGFIPRPRNESEPISNATYGLETHNHGYNRTMYTSMTRSVLVGAYFAMMEDKGGWMYKVHPTPNMIDLNDSGLQVELEREEEFSALGGVRWDQIQGWAVVTSQSLKAAGLEKWDIDQIDRMQKPEKGMPPFNFTLNPDYNCKKYNGLSASPGQPQLAGDEANLAKYNEKSLEEYAIEFMEKNGGPVGFDGKLPLSILKTDAPAETTTAKEMEYKLCLRSNEEYDLTTDDCRAKVAQCAGEAGNQPDYDWSSIAACMNVRRRLV